MALEVVRLDARKVCRVLERRRRLAGPVQLPKPLVQVWISGADRADIALEVCDCGTCKSADDLTSISTRQSFVATFFAPRKQARTVHRVEADDCREQADIGLGQLVATEVLAPVAETLLYAIEPL